MMEEIGGATTGAAARAPAGNEIGTRAEAVAGIVSGIGSRMGEIHCARLADNEHS